MIPSLRSSPSGSRSSFPLQNAFFMQIIIEAMRDRKTMRAQFKKRKHIPVWLTEHLLRQGDVCVCLRAVLVLSSIISSHIQSKCWGKKNQWKYKRYSHFTTYWKTFQSDTDPHRVFCAFPPPFLNATSSGSVSSWENCEMQSSERILLLFIPLPRRQKAVLYLYSEKLLAVCQRYTETHWNLTRVPCLASMFSVSVWCSAEVTASVDTVPTIMPDNEHGTEQIPPVLPAQQQDKFAELPHPSVCTRAKQYMVWCAERKYLRNTTCYFLFFFFPFLLPCC